MALFGKPAIGKTAMHRAMLQVRDQLTLRHCPQKPPALGLVSCAKKLDAVAALVRCSCRGFMDDSHPSRTK